MPIIRRMLAAAAAIVLVIGLSSAPAHALAGNWNVEPGGFSWLFSTDFEITNNGAVIASDETTLDGDFFDDVPSGGIPDPELDHVANLTGLTCNNLHGPFGLVLTPVTSGLWTVYADSQVGDIVNVRVTDLKLGVSGPGCHWLMSGTAHGTYDNNTGFLTIDEPEDSGNLVISEAVCPLFENGDSPGFSAGFQLGFPHTINERP